MQPVNHRARAATVSLHHHAKPIPSGQGGVGQDRPDHLQRQGQTIRLFRVDVEAQPGCTGQTGQRPDAGHQFGHHAVALCHLVARMQRRQLYRYAGVAADVGAGASPGNGGDRAGIGKVIAPRISFGAGGFAQHVIAVGVALCFQLCRALHGGIDGFAQHELAAHFLHRPRHSRADHRLAQPFHRRAQVAGNPRFPVVQHLAGQHQGPGRGIDQRRGRPAQVAAPVGRGNLVFDQRIHGFGIGHAQQRFGEAHQRDAFIGGQAVFGQEDLHQAGAGRASDTAHQIRPRRGDAGAVFGAKRRLGDKPGDQRCLGCQALCADHGPGCVVAVAGHGQAPVFVAGYTRKRGRFSRSCGFCRHSA